MDIISIILFIVIIRLSSLASKDDAGSSLKTTFFSSLFSFDFYLLMSKFASTLIAFHYISSRVVGSLSLSW